MKSRDYWNKRMVELETRQLNKGVAFYHRLAEQYERAVVNITKEVNAFYARYASENKISLLEAKKQLKGRELAAFKMSVEEYIEKGKTLIYSTEWAKELEKASVRYRITRLEALKLQMQQQIEVLTGYEVDGIDKLARDIYEDGYYRTAFIVQKGYGVGSSFMRLDTRKIDKIISAPYTADGLNFSERIWGKHRPELLQKLNTDLVQMLIRGEDPRKLINSIAKRFEVSKQQAGSLVMTESAFFASASTRDSYNALGVKTFQVLATLDSDTCEDCGGREGVSIPMSDYVIGVTAPVFHPRCRCTTTIGLEDDDEPSYRVARDKDGKRVEVPSNMTFAEWQKKFLIDP